MRRFPELIRLAAVCLFMTSCTPDPPAAQDEVGAAIEDFPMVSIVSPLEGTMILGGMLRVGVESRVALGTPGGGTLTVSFGGQSQEAAGPEPGRTFYLDFNTSEVPDGVYEISATVTDTLGAQVVDRVQVYIQHLTPEDADGGDSC